MEVPMGGALDDMKGRVKEAAGDLKDDDDLRREGQADRAAGAVKDKVDAVRDKANEKVDQLRDATRKE
jgi:uncharacterized protein YjbJ (UPF0337 family)